MREMASFFWFARFYVTFFYSCDMPVPRPPSINYIACSSSIYGTFAPVCFREKNAEEEDASQPHLLVLRFSHLNSHLCAMHYVITAISKAGKGHKTIIKYGCTKMSSFDALLRHFMANVNISFLKVEKSQLRKAVAYFYEHIFRNAESSNLARTDHSS
jgi:hypothetical protein